MHRIYLEKRCVIICSHGESSLSDPNSIELHLGDDNADISKLASFFENSENLMRIFIPTDDVEGTYKRFCSNFKEVNAAGGLVSNRREDVLMIKRNGLWDLPKGHQEKGEDIEETAIREVQEETGVDKLKLRKLICVTDHCYFRKEKWHLKHTWWYDMLYTKPVDLIPQRDEDITKAVWIPRSCIASYLIDTYPSIIEVFRTAGI
jgi:ADP-ribose pyrophosphatase YjhB (NUDIX family)